MYYVYVLVLENFKVFHALMNDFDLNDETGRDGETVVKNGTVVPSRRVDIFTYRYLVPSRPVEKISPVALYHPVSSRKYPVTVRSRRQNCPCRPVPSTKPPRSVLSRPVVKPCPYRPVPPSKSVPTVKFRGQNPSLPYLPPIHSRHSFPSRFRDG